MVNKKDPTITFDALNGCFTTIMVGIIAGIILGISTCSKNKELENRIDEMEKVESRPMMTSLINDKVLRPFTWDD